MKNTTRAAAVTATAALAISGATGVANAQLSEGGSSLPGGVSPGSVTDWIGNNTPIGGLVSALTGSATNTSGSAGQGADGSATLSPLAGSSNIEGSAELSPLAGSSNVEGSTQLLGGSSEIGSTGMAPLSTNLLGGSSEVEGSTNLLGGSSALAPLSSDFGPVGSLGPLIGSAGMAPLSTNLLGGSAEFGSADLAPLVGSEDMAPLSTELITTGSDGMAPLSTDLLGGSAEFGSAELAPLGSLGMAPIVSSIGMEPLSTELNLLGGSAELPALSANFPDGSTGGIGGSAEEVGEGISGSLQSDSLETLVGSVQSNSAAELITARAGSIESVTGSLTGETGSTAGSSEVLTGSFGDLTQVNGSLTALTGSLEAGSDNATASSGTGSAVGQLSSLETVSSVGGGLLPILSVGGAAAVAGAALGANVQLPPLPGLPLCDLPQAQIDQLAAAGSVDAQQCPDPQN